MSAMKQIATFAAVASFAALPVMAEEKGEMSEGFDLLSEGTKLLLRGLMSEMEPAFRELEDALDNLHAYHPPEILPNGDIIIRRRTPVEDAPQDEIEL